MKVFPYRRPNDFRETVSDAQGRFNIDQLPDDATYQVRVDGETIDEQTKWVRVNTPDDIVIRR